MRHTFKKTKLRNGRLLSLLFGLLCAGVFAACSPSAENLGKELTRPASSSDALSSAPLQIINNRQLLNPGWGYLENRTSDVAVALTSQGWANVNLPHTWNALDTTDVITGYRRDASWYRKVIIVPTSDTGSNTPKRYLLHFEAAQMRAEIYVNGKKAGEHVGGYVGFDIDITPYIQLNKPTDIMVRVDNSVDRNIIPSQKSDFFLFGGLTRDVYFITKPAVHLDRVAISTPSVSAKAGIVSIVSTVHANPDDDARMVSVKILALDGTIAAQAVQETSVVGTAVQAIFAPITIASPALWSPKTPSLYQVEVSLLAKDGTVMDTQRQPLGFRWYHFEPHGAFYLNGERLLLRGTHRHEEHAGVGSAMSNEMHRADMEAIKDIGANFVRLGHYPQDPEVYRAADELGLILWDELAWCRGGVGGDEWRETTQSLLRKMIIQNYNHPSVFFWSLGNEMYWLPDFEGGGEIASVKAELTALHEIAKEMDPYRPTAIRKFPEGADIVDVYSPSIWAGWYRGGYGQYEDGIAQARKDFPALLHMEYGGSSHRGRHVEDPFGAAGVSAAVGGGVAETINQTGIVSVARAHVWDETYIVDLFDWHLRLSETDPLFAGNAQWAFKDFGTPIRPENPIPFVNQKGLVDRAGKPKDAYHVFKSYWSDEPSCYIESESWTARNGAVGEAKTISVFCNTARAILSLNGTSLDDKERDITKFPASGLTWPVIFRAGTNRLSIEGVDNKGKTVATHAIDIEYVAQKPGALSDIILSYTPDGNGTLLITAEAVDDKGLRCTSCQQRVYFTHSGGGTLAQNLGIPTGSKKVELANGLAAIRFKPDEAQAAVIGVQSPEHRGTYLTIPANAK